jgi:hypothetical protein
MRWRNQKDTQRLQPEVLKKWPRCDKVKMKQWATALLDFGAVCRHGGRGGRAGGEVVAQQRWSGVARNEVEIEPSLV